MIFDKTGKKFRSWLIRMVGDAIALLGKERSLCVIAYHRILEHTDPLLDSEPDIATFTWQMEVLAAGFNVLPLHDALNAMRNGTLPPRAVCVTFDDGYQSTHDVALPIFKKFGLPATVFVTTAFLKEGSMWNDRIIDAVRILPEGTHDLTSIGMGTRAIEGGLARKALVREIDDKCKYLDNAGRLEIIAALEKIAGHLIAKNNMLTREMIVNLDREGIEIGGHTVTHPILTRLSDDEACYEILENKRVLEEITGKPLRLFAYPNGKVGMDFDQRHVKMVADAGYSAAFTTSLGAASKSSDLYQLPRRRPWDQTPIKFSIRLLSWLAKSKVKTASLRGGGGSTLDGYTRTSYRAMLVAYHYPPQSESSGVQRTLSFSKYLHYDGWYPSVLSAHPIAYERKNASQLAQVPGDVVVKRAWALDTKRHCGLFGRYPELLALPDRWVSWWIAAVPLGLAMIRSCRADVIWTTYPIATAHMIGLTLKRLTRRPWVADFRDPMTQMNYPARKWQRAVFHWIERKTIRNCDAAVFTTYSACETYKQRYPKEMPEKFHVIENGFDEEGFSCIDETGVKKDSLNPGGRVTLLHSGVLYADGRDPTAFFEAISKLKETGIVSEASLRVVLRAPGNEDSFKSMVRYYQIEDVVNIEPPISYQEALQEMLEVDGLLIFQGTPFNTQVPAKIYEYFRARKPIFGLLDPVGETGQVLTKAGFSNIANIDCPRSIKEMLVLFLTQIQSGNAYCAGDALIESSSRRHRAHQLAGVFSSLVVVNKS